MLYLKSRDGEKQSIWCPAGLHQCVLVGLYLGINFKPTTGEIFLTFLLLRFLYDDLILYMHANCLIQCVNEEKGFYFY